MDSLDNNNQGKRNTDLWLLLLCSAVGVAAALTLSAGLLANRETPGLVLAAGLAVFPFLPLIWQVLTKTAKHDPTKPGFSAKSRFALRTLAVALVVLGVSWGNLGGKQMLRNLRALPAHVSTKPEPSKEPEPKALPPAAAAHGLESFIPTDATMVIGLAGSSAMEQLLAAYGITAHAELSALATCQIDFANARILIATRASGAPMIVVRAQGIADERNLYCLVGVLGADQLQIRGDGKSEARTFRVNGLLPRALNFRTFDASTLIATEEGWGDSGPKLFAGDLKTVQGRLGQPILRVDRGAPLWLASVAESAQGPWDLALDFRQRDASFDLRGSSTPPSGEADKVELSLRVPLAFVRALPEKAVSQGIRGVVAAVMAVNAGTSSSKASKDAGPR